MSLVGGIQDCKRSDSQIKKQKQLKMENSLIKNTKLFTKPETEKTQNNLIEEKENIKNGVHENSERSFEPKHSLSQRTSPSLSIRIYKFLTPPKNPQEQKSPKKKLVLEKEKLILLVKPTYYMKNLENFFQLKEDNFISKQFKEHFHKNWINIHFGSDFLKMSEAKLQEELKLKDYYPPKLDNRMTIVFDLDNTLISCCDKKVGDFQVSMEYKNRKIEVN